MTNTNEPRIHPLAAADWPPQLAEIQQSIDPPLNIYNTLANHAELLAAWMPLRRHIVLNSSLNARTRELLVLRNAWNTRTDYEWRHHIRRGKQAGLCDTDIMAVQEGPDSARWPDAEAVLLQAVDELNAAYRIADSTWAALCDYFDTRQRLDIIATVGMYTTLSYLIRSCEVPLEEGF